MPAHVVIGCYRVSTFAWQKCTDFSKLALHRRSNSNDKPAATISQSGDILHSACKILVPDLGTLLSLCRSISTGPIDGVLKPYTNADVKSGIPSAADGYTRPIVSVQWGPPSGWRPHSAACSMHALSARFERSDMACTWKNKKAKMH